MADQADDHRLTTTVTTYRFFAPLLRGFCSCGEWFCNAYSQEAVDRRHAQHKAFGASDG